MFVLESVPACTSSESHRSSISSSPWTLARVWSQPENEWCQRHILTTTWPNIYVTTYVNKRRVGRVSAQRRERDSRHAKANALRRHKAYSTAATRKTGHLATTFWSNLCTKWPPYRDWQTLRQRLLQVHSHVQQARSHVLGFGGKIHFRGERFSVLL